MISQKYILFNTSIFLYFILILVLNNINKITALRPINIFYNCTVINNTSEIELNKFINEA